ncbi:MAG: ATP-grasp domain-containing protein, partial [Thermoleophilia bacterium]|nr:ATP-grasp domain-containing protein [Thermoleophilia bacterium]
AVAGQWHAGRADRADSCDRRPIAVASGRGRAPARQDRRCLRALRHHQRRVRTAVRGRDGHIVTYPLIENAHHDGILHRSVAPAPELGEELPERAAEFASRVLTELDYVGILTIEWFQDGPRLLANEMAPRVHNSGHWTIEGALTSQFENHVRAVCGLPLGRTDAVGHSVMYNFIGDVPGAAEVLTDPDAHLHLYGKGPRPGRKVGHVTLRAGSATEAQEKLPDWDARFARR